MTDPPWVIDHAVKIQLSAQRASVQARNDRLALAREKERKIKQAGQVGAFKGGDRKRVKVGVERNAAEGEGREASADDEFLPEDKEEANGNEGIFLSKEVRELMAK